MARAVGRQRRTAGAPGEPAGPPKGAPRGGAAPPTGGGGRCLLSAPPGRATPPPLPAPACRVGVPTGSTHRRPFSESMALRVALGTTVDPARSAASTGKRL